MYQEHTTIEKDLLMSNVTLCGVEDEAILLYDLHQDFCHAPQGMISMQWEQAQG